MLRSTARRLLATGLVVVGAVAACGALRVPFAQGAYLARVTNSTNSVATDPYFTCTAAVKGETGTTTAYLAYPFGETATSALSGAADVSGNARTGSYASVGVTFGVTGGPCTRDAKTAITLNGSSGYVTGPTTTVNPTTFSEEIWFRTATGGGQLIGIGNRRSSASTSYDRQVYLTNTGNVAFDVSAAGTVKVVASPATYLTNTWHQVIATQAPAGTANPGMRLYVDGTLVASDSTVVSNLNASGYVRIGYDNLAGLGSTSPTNNFYTGSLAWAALYATVALSPAQVAAHYAAGT